MPTRMQQTLARPVTLKGVGFLTGADISVRFLPAAADEGISFKRVDGIFPVTIPARAEFTAPRSRRTALQSQGVSIELIEHVMAALAGLRIDNCLIEVNGPELPGCDGSSQIFADAFLNAGLLNLGSPRASCGIHLPLQMGIAEHDVSLRARPSRDAGLKITYELDYGPESPIPPQTLTIQVTPETFIQKLAFARTFVLEEEARAFLAQGMGQRLSFQDLVVYGPDGVIDNELRAPDECVRHKILDCIGDLALIGCDLNGHVLCRRTGHRHNVELVRALQAEQQCQTENEKRFAA